MESGLQRAAVGRELPEEWRSNYGAVSPPIVSWKEQLL